MKHATSSFSVVINFRQLKFIVKYLINELTEILATIYIQLQTGEFFPNSPMQFRNGSPKRNKNRRIMISNLFEMRTHENEMRKAISSSNNSVKRVR